MLILSCFSIITLQRRRYRNETVVSSQPIKKRSKSRISKLIPNKKVTGFYSCKIFPKRLPIFVFIRSDYIGINSDWIKVPMKRNFGLSFYCLTWKTIWYREECNLQLFDIFFSFQSYKGLNIPNQRDIKKGLGTRICDVIWLKSQFCENLSDLFLI